jgi:predicted acyl esterase
MLAYSQQPLLLSLIVAFILLGSCSAQENSFLQPGQSVDITWGVKIPMRDGVKLNATLYRPHARTEPLPVIVTLTPYIADEYHARGIFFARNGYVFASVDCRGRGNSEGDFVPFVHEARDGYDAVEWLARQPWSNGKIGMWGGSYGGYNQWATLSEFPPHLATIISCIVGVSGQEYADGEQYSQPILDPVVLLDCGQTFESQRFRRPRILGGQIPRSLCEAPAV